MQRLQNVWSCGPELSRTYAAKGIQAHRLRLVEAGLRQRARSRIVQWWQLVTTVMTKISMHGRLGLVRSGVSRGEDCNGPMAV